MRSWSRPAPARGARSPTTTTQRVGALIASVDDVWDGSDLLLKVKEPIQPEYAQLREGLILFTYLHIAADEPLTRALIDSGITAVAYETVEVGRTLPLLAPMSEVAGRLAPQAGAHFLEKPLGGRGLLLGAVPGVAPGKVVIVGGGVVGYNAAVIALGLGAQVTILDRSIDRMRHLEEVLSGRVTLLMSSSLEIAAAVAEADLVIGAVLIPGALAPKLVTRAMIASMRPGAVVVDVAIDQGGCFETSHATTHAEPVYVVDGVTHYCVANMPGAVPITSTHVADERDAALRRGDREPRATRRGRGGCVPREGRQRDRAQGHVPGGRGSSRPRAHTARGGPPALRGLSGRLRLRREQLDDDPRHSRRERDDECDEEGDPDQSKDVGHRSRIARCRVRASSCWTPSERANYRMRPSSATKARTRSPTSPVRSAASTCPRWRRSGWATSSLSRAARRSPARRRSPGGCSSGRRARTRRPGTGS